MFEKETISVIIPTLNEEKNLTTLIPYLQEHLDSSQVQYEIIVSDSTNSQDGTKELCDQYDIVYLECQKSQRSIQLCEGAKLSQYEILYFMHADTTPPETFATDILQSINSDYKAGCFAYQFDNCTPILLKLNAWFTQYNTLFTGGGDQGLFITKDTYKSIGGYKHESGFMEDFEFYKLIKKNSVPFTIVKNRAVVSNRKYHSNSYLKVQIVQGLLLIGFNLGISSDRLRQIYHALL